LALCGLVADPGLTWEQARTNKPPRSIVASMPQQHPGSGVYKEEPGASVASADHVSMIPVVTVLYITSPLSSGIRPSSGASKLSRPKVSSRRIAKHVTPACLLWCSVLFCLVCTTQSPSRQWPVARPASSQARIAVPSQSPRRVVAILVWMGYSPIPRISPVVFQKDTPRIRKPALVGTRLDPPGPRFTVEPSGFFLCGGGVWT